ncbi:MAG: CPBP family intramembrane metalloprotease [Clostridia bacterium]|nr:CPBP family intramembrane metalloprotease [Clostridia bacterium]
MENNAEKKRRIVNAVAAAVSFFAAFGLSRLLFFAASALLKTDAALPAGVSAALTAVSLGVGCAPALAVARPRPEAEGEFPGSGEPLRSKKPAYLVPAAVFLLLAVNVLISTSGLVKTDAPSYSTRELIIRAILGCTVYPVLEETFFRGVLLGALRERDDPIPARIGAAVVTAVGFAAFHPGSGYVFPFAAGVILAAIAPYGLTAKKRSLIPVGPIAAHALYNLALYVSLALTATGIEPVVPLSVFAGIAAIAAGVMLLTGGKARWKEKK